ncbi:HET-domain-containing protein [Pyrenochaeta sp. DS3sAY3a]|nr:HET-domain-containing protein [Pyrenochaeta sp. DS3sAY3a]
MIVTLSGHESQSFQIYAFDEGLNMETTPIQRSIPVLPTSDSVVSKVLGWIHECETLHKHKKSALPSTSRLPKRMIEILQSNHSKVRLVTPKDSDRFVALSYCWGDGKQSPTTRENLETRCQGFFIDMLPRTIQDAIHFTRLLGIQYIWVDALCIVQDTEGDSDFYEESSKMEFIYSSAYVVLAAAQAKDCTEGFLKSRSSPVLLGSQMAQPFKNHEKFQARKMDSHSINWFAIRPAFRDSPIFKRAWCMQERLLATRILHFLSDEILFSCEATHRCECGTLSYHQPEESYDTPMPSIWGKEIYPNKPRHLDTYLFVWARVIESFSMLDLTRQTDALPALAGIARRFEGIYPECGRYIAGLWENGLGCTLNWTESLRKPEGNPVPWLKASIETKNDTSRYPSFSWISAYALRQETGSTCISISTYSSDDTHLYPIALSRSSTSIEGSFERFVEGSITVRGLCLPGNFVSEMLYETNRRIRTSPSAFLFRLNLDHYGLFQLTSEVLQKIQSDVDWSSTLCLGLSWTGNSANNHFQFATVTALLLKCTSDGSQYVRIGLFNFLDKDFFDLHAREMDVSLV